MKLLTRLDKFKKEEDSNKATADGQVLSVTTTQPGVQVFPPTVDLTTGEPTSRVPEPRVAATIEIVKGAPTLDLFTVRDFSEAPKPTAIKVGFQAHSYMKGCCDKMAQNHEHQIDD